MKPDLKPIEEILGEDTPEISLDAVGKYRMHRAFRNKFGESYRSKPEVQKALSHFDSEKHYFGLLNAMKGHRNGSGRSG